MEYNACRLLGLEFKYLGEYLTNTEFKDLRSIPELLSSFDVTSYSALHELSPLYNDRNPLLKDIIREIIITPEACNGVIVARSLIERFQRILWIKNGANELFEIVIAFVQLYTLFNRVANLLFMEDSCYQHIADQTYNEYARYFLLEEEKPQNTINKFTILREDIVRIVFDRLVESGKIDKNIRLVDFLLAVYAGDFSEIYQKSKHIYFHYAVRQMATAIKEEDMWLQSVLTSIGISKKQLTANRAKIEIWADELDDMILK